tara:strand:- start:319 stop:738 length:420 start_codon:yes stop_codon:yes gene_type:complete
MQTELYSIDFPQHPSSKNIETARILIRAAKSKDVQSRNGHLRQRVLESLGEYAKATQVKCLVLRPMSGHENDADGETKLGNVLAAILAVCGDHVEISVKGESWSVYAGFNETYIVRRCSVTWLTQMAVEHQWNLECVCQ